MDSVQIHRQRADDGTPVCRLDGALTIDDGAEAWRRLRAAVDPSANGEVGPAQRIDLSGLRIVDGAGAALLLALRAEASMAGRPIELAGANADVARMLDLYGCPNDVACLKAQPREPAVLEQIGAGSVTFAREARQVITAIGDVFVAGLAALRRPRSVPWRDVPRLMERAGADGVPIVLLINFLVGLIIALQAAEQLRRYGANMFLSPLVGITMARELAPLMTAIIVAGRSGAAYAAELGTMRVNEEIDALRSLGFDPTRYLVLPRVIALGTMVPMLTLLGAVVGCVGGLVIGVTMLELTPTLYWNKMQEMMGPLDMAEGLTKSFVFAVMITFIACQRGLTTRGGAAGVGNATTKAVVTILFSLVTVDALLSTFFNWVRR